MLHFLVTLKLSNLIVSNPIFAQIVSLQINLMKRERNVMIIAAGKI